MGGVPALGLPTGGLWLTRCGLVVPAEITLLESQVRALQAAKVAEETAAAAAAAAATATGNGNGRESGKDAGGKGGSWWPWS